MNLKKFFDEAHEIAAIALVLIALGALGARMYGLDSLGDGAVAGLLVFAALFFAGGVYRKIKAGPGGIDIEQ